MNEDGTMARLPQLRKIADKFDLKIISIKDLIEYRLKTDSTIEEIVRVDLPTKYGQFQTGCFQGEINRWRASCFDKG
jgi:3,4-dihydroxy 2-butanone 4-phosphate synthase/GTP cyclohydrolase II